MKKVRFQTPTKNPISGMEDLECHSPRPYIEKKIFVPNNFNNHLEVVSYSNDPLIRYDSSNSFPYASVNKTEIKDSGNLQLKCLPTNDLELSMLDSSSNKQKSLLPRQNKTPVKACTDIPIPQSSVSAPSVLSSIENKLVSRGLRSDENFFFTRENIGKMQLQNIEHNFSGLSVNKENSCKRKVEENKIQIAFKKNDENILEGSEKCCSCVKAVKNDYQDASKRGLSMDCGHFHEMQNKMVSDELYSSDNKRCSHCVYSFQVGQCHMGHHSVHKNDNFSATPPCIKQNMFDKRAWLEKNIENTKSQCTHIERQTNICKDKREPTVADLFKIIKLQNEQLQLLHEKVDKFTSGKQITYNSFIPTNMHKCSTDRFTYKHADQEQRISIGVMTSFEMVHTSTIVNKEACTQQNAQIHCNQSQISIKEGISSMKPTAQISLEGLIPEYNERCPENAEQICIEKNSAAERPTDHEEKTLNDASLCNIQINNAITPLMSPDQSLYIDIKDYSDSETSNDDQSNFGWTYYHKVMNHVNGMLQDSDMPSSASALYRNTKQQCVQMQIDKANISVTKRVKFGDDPLGILQPHLPTASSEVSLKMNQLAAKYLKNGQPTPVQIAAPVYPPVQSLDLSYATLDYMERHKLIKGRVNAPGANNHEGIPKFLDITALKQQPKLL